MGRIALLAMCAALFGVLAAGCGGGSSSSAGSTASTSTSVSSSAGGSKGESNNAGASAGSESGSSAPFLKKGEESKIPEFGEEGQPDEREAASEVLEESLQARAAGEWAKQCATLTARPIKELAENSALQGRKSNGCVGDLKFEAEPLAETKAIRANTMTGPIYALRISGDHAYALYRGTEGKTYAMAMVKIDGAWKINNLVTAEIPKS